MPIQRETSRFALGCGDVKGFALSREIMYVLMQSIRVRICKRSAFIITKNVCAHTSEILINENCEEY